MSDSPMIAENRNQEMWPFGPAPMKDCRAGGAHEWKVIDLYQACDPPAPSFQCDKCQYKWSRRWTKAEFRRVILKGAESDPYYGDGSQYPDEPEYRPRLTGTEALPSVKS